MCYVVSGGCPCTMSCWVTNYFTPNCASFLPYIDSEALPPKMRLVGRRLQIQWDSSGISWNSYRRIRKPWIWGSFPQQPSLPPDFRQSVRKSFVTLTISVTLTIRHQKNRWTCDSRRAWKGWLRIGIGVSCIRLTFGTGQKKRGCG